MRVLITAALAGAALVSLTACNKSASSTGSAGSPVAGAAPAASGPMTVQQIPHRKPGLWRQTIAMDGESSPGPGTQLCVDAASEAKMSIVAQHMTGMHCDTPQFSRNLDGSISFSNNCDMGANGKTQTRGTIKGDFNSSYVADMDTKFSGSSMPTMNGDHKMTITATWTGACAPGQKGGDMILANGMKMNVLEHEGAAPSGGG
jgi:hypothetical protein